MNSVKRVLWGIVLILIGLLWALEACGVIDFNFFFDGWWTLFLVVPCLIGLITDHDKRGNFIGLLIGVALFLVCNDILSMEMFWSLLIPTVIIVIGIWLVFGNKLTAKREKARKKAEEKLHEKGERLQEYCATFSSVEVDFHEKLFSGASLTAVFGGVKCDLRNAVFEGDAVIRVCAIFGGIDILLPENADVNITVTQIFGGVSNKAHCKASENTPTVHLDGYCIFGGVDLK